MNICQAYTSHDKAQVQRWLDWVSELGGLGRHKLFLMPCCGESANFKTDLPFTVVADEWKVQSDWSTGNGAVRDASGANTAPRQFAWKMHLEKLGPWMFCEPDCIPLRTGWHDELEDEYSRANKPFMGARVRVDNVVEHMTGNAIYHQDAAAHCRLLMLAVHAEIEGQRVELAFDVACAPDVLQEGRFHETRLIQHVFRGPKFEKMDHLARIDPAACCFHTDKDGGLINLLHRQRGGEVVTREEVIVPVCAGAIPAPARPADKPCVYTYFRPCVDPEALDEQKRILAIWEKNWREHGWEPVILTEAHAKKHPRFEQYYNSVYRAPTVSPKDYEMAAWLRWIAMQVVGGGLMIDYDVVCNGTFGGGTVEGPFPLILSDNNPVPCAVLGSAQQFENAIRAFQTCPVGEEQGQPHLSDMLAVQMLKFPAKDVCREAGTDDWQKAQLIHFSHRRCGNKRSEMMLGFTCGMGDVATFKSADVVGLEKAVNGKVSAKRPIMEEIRERLVWIKDNSRGITRHHVHRELKALGLLPKK